MKILRVQFATLNKQIMLKMEYCYYLKELLVLLFKWINNYLKNMFK